MDWLMKISFSGNRFAIKRFDCPDFGPALQLSGQAFIFKTKHAGAWALEFKSSVPLYHPVSENGLSPSSRSGPRERHG
jgi:hypothetical protein